MAMGKRRRRGRQPSMWVASSDLPRSAGHPFYERLNRVLDDSGFDAFVEEQCARFYADEVGRPSLPPGRYFRMLLVGYFEGLESERAIAWRAADSLSLRQFLDVPLDAASTDHSTVSRTRRRVAVETHLAVFTWVLQRLADAGLVRGATVGIDATTLEANAVLRSIVRRDTDADYETFLRQLAAASGIATQTRAQLAKLDSKRPKKGSNDDWTHPEDPDAKVSKMKDGRTRLAHKAEHAVDLETGAVVGLSVQDADAGDTQTMLETLVVAAEQVDAVQPTTTGITELVLDKGYHSNQTLVTLAELGIRSYVSEPDRGRRNWRGKQVARDAVYGNRRRIRVARGKRLLRLSGERLERPNAHLYATGRQRRVHLRGHDNILKRVLLHACGFNLGLLMRQLMGVGTPCGLQGCACALVDALRLALRRFWSLVSRSAALLSENWTAPSWIRPMTPTHSHILSGLHEGSSATGC
ncbi:MAG: transposase [Acidobacteria bacterium]|nr:transposase [Acidobacteriota bacterium]